MRAHMHTRVCNSLKAAEPPRVQSAQSCLTLCDPRTVARQAALSMEFSGQEYWSGLPFPTPGDLPDPGIELESPAWKADSLPLSHLEAQQSLLG